MKLNAKYVSHFRLYLVKYKNKIANQKKNFEKKSSTDVVT